MVDRATMLRTGSDRIPDAVTPGRGWWPASWCVITNSGCIQIYIVTHLCSAVTGHVDGPNGRT